MKLVNDRGWFGIGTLSAVASCLAAAAVIPAEEEHVEELFKTR